MINDSCCFIIAECAARNKSYNHKDALSFSEYTYRCWTVAVADFL